MTNQKSDLENLILNGIPIPRAKTLRVTHEELYWRTHEEGKKRFGADCFHLNVQSGHCTNCLRKIIS